MKGIVVNKIKKLTYGVSKRDGCSEEKDRGYNYNHTLHTVTHTVCNWSYSLQYHISNLCNKHLLAFKPIKADRLEMGRVVPIQFSQKVSLYKDLVSQIWLQTFWTKMVLGKPNIARPVYAQTKRVCKSTC